MKPAWGRRGWTLRPNGEMYPQLVFDEWWTREQLQTDAKGVASLRGFLGDYRITVTVDGQSHAVEHALSVEPTTGRVRVTLP